MKWTDGLPTDVPDSGQYYWFRRKGSADRIIIYVFKFNQCGRDQLRLVKLGPPGTPEFHSVSELFLESDMEKHEIAGPIPAPKERSKK